MARMETPVCDFGWKAVDFALPGVDGKTYTLKDVAGPNGLLVMFICNHCPYVKAVIDRIVRMYGNCGNTASAPSPSCPTTRRNTRGQLRQHGRAGPAPGFPHALCAG
jgi:peroxiredoxin